MIFASAAHAGSDLVVAAACDPGLPGVSVVRGLEWVFVCLRGAFAATLSEASLAHPAGAAQNAGNPAAWNLSVQALPVFPAEVCHVGQALFARLAPDSFSALWGHAAGNGNCAVEAHAAAPCVRDTDPLNTGAGRWVAGQVPG